MGAPARGEYSRGVLTGNETFNRAVPLPHFSWDNPLGAHCDAGNAFAH